MISKQGCLSIGGKPSRLFSFLLHNFEFDHMTLKLETVIDIPMLYGYAYYK